MGARMSTKEPAAIWIFVAGPSGAGKTSLINVLWGDGNGGAPPAPNTGSKVVSYSHPIHPNVTIWEYPSTYENTIDLDLYDLLIIASPLDTFASDYVKFAKDGQAKGKACYFVRTKIDAEVQRCGSIINSISQLDRLVDGTASSCTDLLEEDGVQSPLIFLVSNINTDMYHFPLFRNTIEGKINQLNRSQGLLEDSSRQSSSSACTVAAGLDLAVFGDRWSGKSSLINALRGLQADDEGATQTGTGEPATKPAVYPFPKYPNIRIWELPVITDNLQPEQYLKQVTGEKYGTFIIITSDIFKEHHSKLSKTLENMGKGVLFVRTKIDGDLQAFKHRNRSQYNETKCVEEIRQICVNCLGKGGVEKPKVYILSNFETEKFDFRPFRSRIENHPEVIKCEIFERLSKEERDEMDKAFESGGLPQVASKILARLQSVDHIRINIGVIGEAGAGKSSLVNAIRGVLDDQSGAAPTGVTETTMVPTSYSHPTLANVQIWDLPGLGTSNFPLEKYREWVGFERYDYFIIVASERFKENHAKLAKWINERGARFYFVRTKIDSDIEASRTRRSRQFNKDQVLKEMKDDSLQSLKEQGVKSPQVFLVSALKFEEYEAKQLQETLERELPRYRKQAFLRPIATFSSEVIEKKRNFLSMEIWKLALLSSVAAAAPIPGLGFVCDYRILLKYLPIYYKSFGLDEESLQRISLEIEKPVEDLKAQIRSPNMKDINTSLLYKLLSNSAGIGMMTGEYFLRGIPVFGSVASGGIGFATTRVMLNRFLKDLSADAERVLKWVIDSKTE